MNIARYEHPQHSTFQANETSLLEHCKFFSANVLVLLGCYVEEVGK